MSLFKSTTLLFTGQGSQKVGMTKCLEKNYPRIMKYIYEEASASLKFDIKKILFDGPTEKLTSTSIAQPAIVLHSYSILSILKNEFGINFNKNECNYVLGHSAGEYSALLAADSISFYDAINLVHNRGKIIEAGVKDIEPTAMAALMPISTEDAENIANEASKKTNKICEIANYNSKYQCVLSGHKESINEAKLLAKKKRIKAVLLDVSAPFHCSILEQSGVKKRFSEYIDNIQFKDLSIPLISNVSGEEVTDQKILKSLLKEQISSPVYFNKCINYVITNTLRNENSEMNFIEFGYGGVLSNIIKRHTDNSPNIKCTPIGTYDQIESFIGSLETKREECESIPNQDILSSEEYQNIYEQRLLKQRYQQVTL